MRGTLFAFAFAFGCAPSTDFDAGRRLGVTTSAVQGGKLDTSHGFAVAIVGDDSICSGTLIAPNLVLTARHCVSVGGGDTIDCAVDRFGRTMRPQDFRVTTDAVVRDDSPSHAVAEILVPPTKEFCGSDIALLRLQDLVDASEATPVTPAVEFPLTDSSHYGTEVALIGYGITTPSGSDDGTRRRRDGVPLVCVPGRSTLDCGDLTEREIAATEFLIPEGACTGDSGSSAFDQASLGNGTPIALGVLSRASETSSRCTEAVYTRTDSFKDFIIESAIKAAQGGEYPVPIWAGGAAPTEPSSIVTGPDASAAPKPRSNADPSSSGCTLANGAGERTSPLLAWLALGAVAFLSRRRGRAGA